MSVKPYDEKEIGDADNLIRRINPDQHVVRDENLGCSRISTKAFSPSSEEDGGMSVDIESLIEADDQDPREFVTTPTYTGSVVFTAIDARKLGLIVGYDPVPENPYHGEVWGDKRPNRFTNSQKNRLKAISEWYVEIPDVNLT